MSPRPAVRVLTLTLAAGAVSALVGVGATGAASAAPRPGSAHTVAGGAQSATVQLSPNGSLVVTAKGNGHGHGMSQYGAQGAALDGKSWRQIVAFYYPGTRLTNVGLNWIRVRVSGFGSTTTVAPYSDLTVTGVAGQLPTSGVGKWRLVAAKTSGLTLQQLTGAAGHQTWHAYRSGLANGASFHRPGGDPIRIFQPDGSSTSYYGSLAAVRSGSGVYTVNRVSINKYTAGVVPREMPSGWERAATDAQAIAARTYGWYAVQHPRSSHYDICDTTDCQVYGGHTRYSRAGNVRWTDFWRAAGDTSDEVLDYGGHVAFTQFSASNGGWSVDGGQPYLVAKQDPYDSSRSGDPYLSYTQQMSVASLGRAFGIARLTSITVTRRDGHGTWGGRVLAATLAGRTGSGAAKTVRTDGTSLQWALGLGTTWFTVSPAR